MRESVHEYQQMDEDEAPGDYSIDGISPLLIKPESAASPSSVEKKSMFSKEKSSEVDPAVTKSEI